MSLDLPELTFILTAVSTSAVVAGAGFVVFQLRQNARLIDAATRENRSNIAFSMLERIIDDSFVRRRKNVYDTVDKYSARNWEGLLYTLEDLEARNYAHMFELFGQFVRNGIIDKITVMDALGGIVVSDWKKLEPMLRYLILQSGLKRNPWANFEWLAKETEKYLDIPEPLAVA